MSSNPDLIQNGEFRGLSSRGLTLETVTKWGYRVASLGGKPIQIADYKDDAGTLVAQKVRFPNKGFETRGDFKAAGLYGQHLWNSGKKLVITEGEIDAMSMSQLQGNKWPVVSVPNGAAAAKKALQRQLEWLEGFDEVVLMFDADEAGQSAVEECVELFSPGKVKVARLPEGEDPNSLLLANKGDAVIEAMWRAKEWRPDGILAGDSTWDIIADEPDVPSIPYPWEFLNEKLRGMRRGEIVTLGAGSGTGKSLVCREIAHWLLQQGESVGIIALEENVRRTALGVMSIEANKPLHLDKNLVSEEELRTAWERTLGTGRCFLLDHWGSLDTDVLLSRVRYMARGMECGWVILDHLSIVVSGLDGGDERRLIDQTMTRLRGLVEETNIGLLLVSHLKRPQGDRGHEEGVDTSLSHFRGSASIAQLSDGVVGLERNQQDGEHANHLKVRVLKNRFTGDTGLAGTLVYNKDTGRLEMEDYAAFTEAATSEPGGEGEDF